MSLFTWRLPAPAGWPVCLPLLLFPCTVKSRSSPLAPAHPGGPGKRAVNGSGLAVFVERQEGHPAHRKSVPLIPGGALLEQVKEDN